jgi:UDP-N-acetylmuramate dehydrogenase
LEDLGSAGVLRSDHAIAGMTTYKFGGTAAWYAEVESREVLDQILATRNRTAPDMGLFVLGRGSNVVVSDAGFDGIVVRLAGIFNELAWEGSVINAGAGVALPRLARFCSTKSRGGLEFYVGIPGSVGGAVVMNAGGHGADTAAWLVDATVLDMDSGVVTVEDATQLDLAYRHSRLGAGDVVLSARFRTVERDPGEPDLAMREITAWRREHQPGGTFNAGSVFKNPPADAAGRLIDVAGLKGHRRGGVSVSHRHANFFVAEAGGCAQDVYDLVRDIRRLVLERTGVDLQPEIRFIGHFGESP